MRWLWRDRDRRGRRSGERQQGHRSACRCWSTVMRVTAGGFDRYCPVRPNSVYKPEWMARRWKSKQYNNAPMPYSIFFHRGFTAPPRLRSSAGSPRTVRAAGARKRRETLRARAKDMATPASSFSTMSSRERSAPKEDGECIAQKVELNAGASKNKNKFEGWPPPQRRRRRPRRYRLSTLKKIVPPAVEKIRFARRPNGRRREGRAPRASTGECRPRPEVGLPLVTWFI